MHPHDPYQQDPYQHQPYQQQPYYPPAYVEQPSEGMSRWAVVLWVTVPALLVILCCAGCVVSGFAGGFMEGFNEGRSSS
ncbi:hypothetical protein [Micromonospora sp. NPDC048169]|uniref:hypothetical protein n=1 Tax=unclassified Micromonospora TaxID=2617518 RepID=UPI0033C2EA8A